MNIFTRKKSIKIPKGVTSKLHPDKIRFCGSKASISIFAEELKKLQDMKNRTLVQLDKVELKVSDEITLRYNDANYIEMPQQAWGILASKFQDVVEGFEENPFDFNDCGYLYPKLSFDIGIEIVDRK